MGASLAAEKRQKAAEEQEFRSAKSGAKIEKKISLLGNMTPKARPEGPAPEKRKIPSFLKLKSKDSVSSDGGEPEQKQQRLGSAASVDSSVNELVPQDLPPPPRSSPASSVGGSSAGGGLLVGYGSDED